jgi:chromosome partitioning protein
MPLWRRDRARRDPEASVPATVAPTVSAEGATSDDAVPEPEIEDLTVPSGVPEVKVGEPEAEPEAPQPSSNQAVADGEADDPGRHEDAVESASNSAPDIGASRSGSDADVEPALEAVASELVSDLTVEPAAPGASLEQAPIASHATRPAHARGTPVESFTERAQLAMERLGSLPQVQGLSSPRPLPRVLAIANQKGGVGKTTTTVNLGAALSELDYRVLVVDLDPQGNATSGLGIDTRNFDASMYDVIMRDAPIEDCIEPTSVQNLFVTPATIDLAGVEIELVSAFSRELKLKRAIDTVVDDFDFVLIDCPPSLGLLTVNGLAAATEVMVPIQCEYYALEGLSQLTRNVDLVASHLNPGLQISAIVLTMFDARTRLAVEVADEVRSHFKELVCRSIIPRTVRLSEAPSFGQPITVFDPSSRGAVAYRELAKEVSNGAPKRSG